MGVSNPIWSMSTHIRALILVTEIFFKFHTGKKVVSINCRLVWLTQSFHHYCSCLGTYFHLFLLFAELCVVGAECGFSLVHEDIMYETINTYSTEQLISPLIRFICYVLAQVASHTSLVGHHDFIYGPDRCCRNLQESIGDYVVC